jgi:hypothetical protein
MARIVQSHIEPARALGAVGNSACLGGAKFERRRALPVHNAGIRLPDGSQSRVSDTTLRRCPTPKGSPTVSYPRLSGLVQ